jgi:predicted metalloprotease
MNLVKVKNCGERGIRTLVARKRQTVFETVPFNHSGISPGAHKIKNSRHMARVFTTINLNKNALTRLKVSS